jgi:PadR family transcriptional regulator PadR
MLRSYFSSLTRGEERATTMAEPKPSGLVQGTLHMLILKTLALEPLHGYGIGLRLEQISRGVFQVNAGSLFPALRRLERDGLISGEWRTTENNRRAKYYSPTTRGRAMLKRETRDWEAQATAIARILRATSGELS